MQHLRLLSSISSATSADVCRSPLYDFNRVTSTDEYVQLFNSEMRRILDL